MLIYTTGHPVLDCHVGAFVRLWPSTSWIAAQKKEIGTHRQPVSNSGRQLDEEIWEIKFAHVRSPNIAQLL